MRFKCSKSLLQRPEFPLQGIQDLLLANPRPFGKELENLPLLVGQLLLHLPRRDVSARTKAHEDEVWTFLDLRPGKTGHFGQLDHL
jgi:hypothetical protein